MKKSLLLISSLFAAGTLSCVTATTASAATKVTAGTYTDDVTGYNSTYADLTALRNQFTEDYYFTADGGTISGDFTFGSTTGDEAGKTQGLVIADAVGGTQILSGTISGNGVLAIRFVTGSNDSNGVLKFTGNMGNFSGTLLVNPVEGSGSAHSLIFSDTSTYTASTTAMAGTASIATVYTAKFEGIAGRIYTIANSSIYAKTLEFSTANYSVTNSVTGNNASGNLLTVSSGTTTINGAVSNFQTIHVSEDASLNLAGTNTMDNVAFENDGGTLAISGTTTIATDDTSATATMMLSAGTVSVASTGTLDLSGAQLRISEGASLENAGTIKVDDSTRIVLSSYTAGTTIISGTGAISGTIDQSTFGLRDATITVSNSDVTLSAITTADLTWNATSGYWNTTASNWTNSSTSSADKFYWYDNVTFKGTNTGTLTLQEEIIANKVTLSASSATTFALNGQSLRINNLELNSNLTISGNGSAEIATADVKSGTLTFHYNKSNTLSIDTLKLTGGDAVLSLSTATNYSTAGSASSISNVELGNGRKLSLYGVGYSFDKVTVDTASEITFVNVSNANSHDAAIKSLSGSGTLTLSGNIQSSVLCYYVLGDSTSTATKADFSGTVVLSENQSGGRPFALAIVDKYVAADAVIKLASVKSTTLNTISLAIGAEDVIIGGLDNSSTNSANYYLISRSLDTLSAANITTGDGTARTLTFDVASGGDYTFSGTVKGAFNFVKTGVGAQKLASVLADSASNTTTSVAVSKGTLTLSGANTYTGGTTITGGTLVADNAKALGAGKTKISGGGQLTIGSASAVTLSGSAIEIVLDSYAGADTAAAILGYEGSSISLGTGETIALSIVSATALEYHLFDSAIASSYSEDSFSLSEAMELAGWSIANYDISTGVITLAIPEPSMFGLLAGTLVLALAGTRRRRGNAK